jgi:hypothetical protein
MDHDRKELIQPVRVLDIVTRVGELQLSGEWDAVEELGVSTQVLLILETLKVERKYVW